MKTKKLIFIFVIIEILSGYSYDTNISNRNYSDMQANYNEYDIRNYIHDYEKIIANNKDVTLTVVFNDAIEWLYLSLDGYADDRNKIEEYESEIISCLEKISPERLPLKIAIAEYDINNDGVEEIIAFHNGDGGAKDAGVLNVYFQDQEKKSIINGIRIVGVPDVDFLNSQGIGIIKKVDGTLDFIILNRLYIWNGEKWSID